jgi:hypothetical protein
VIGPLFLGVGGWKSSKVALGGYAQVVFGWMTGRVGWLAL